MTRHMTVSTDAKTGGGGHNTSVGWALASLALSTLMPSLDTSIANAGLPTLAHAFGASFQATQWIVLAYLLTITALIVSAGRLGDLLGRRRLLLAGIALFTLASLACGAAPSLSLLLICRALQGLGAAMMVALTVAMVGETVPQTKIGRAMGLLGTMSAIGTTLGPSLGGVLMTALGWRSIFLVNVPLGLLNLLLARRYLPADRRTATLRDVGFDVPGTGLLAFALVAYALSMTLGHGRFGGLNVLLLLAAAVGGAWFMRVQSRSASPLIRPSLLRDAGLAGSLVMNALVATVMMATLVVGPFFLTRGLGLGMALAGLVLSAGPLTSASTGVLAGRIVDRWGASRMRIAGLAQMTLGAFALAVLPERFGIVGYLGAIVILTPGYQLFQASNKTLVMIGVQRDQRGVVSGMLSLARNLGLVTGASMMGAVFAFASATRDVSSASAGAVTTGMRTTFIVAAALIVVALGIGLAGRVRAARLLQCEDAS